MVEVECVARKWGSSLGVIIPKEIVEKEHIKPNQKVWVNVKTLPLAKTLWGLAPVKDKRPVQEIKDELRRGWG